MKAAVVVCAAGPGLAAHTDDGSSSHDAAARTAPNQSITIDAPNEMPDPKVAPAGGDPAHLQRSPIQDDPSAEVQPLEESRPRASGMVRRIRGEVTTGEERVTPSAFDVGSLVALGVVLLIVVAVFWFLRRFVPSLGNADHSALQVVARAAISPKHNIALVRFGRRYVLVGVGGDRMSRLCEVSEPQEVAELTAHFGGARQGQSSVFSQLLARESEAFDDAEHIPDAGRHQDRQTPSNEGDAERMPGLIRLRQRLRSLKAG